LCRPVNASAGDISHYIDKQDAVAFWLAYSFAFDDTEPLPPMFRRKTPAWNAELASVSAVHSEDTIAPVAGLSIFRASNMAASYIFACVLFLFAAVDGALLTLARFSPDQTAPSWTATEKGAVETAALSPSMEAAEEPQALAIDSAGSAQLLKRLENGVNASIEMPVEAPGACAVPSLNCWKSATFIR